MNSLIRFGLLACLATPQVAAAQGLAQLVREARIGGAMLSTTRTSVLDQSSTHAVGSGTLVGGEAVIRFGGFGVRARTLSGDLDSDGQGLAGTFSVREVAAQIGPTIFAIEGGLKRRTTSPSDSVIVEDLLRAGVRSQFGASGGAVQVTLSAGLTFMGEAATADKAKRVGHDAEVQVIVQPSAKVPVYVGAGYLYESFDDPHAVGNRVEEQNGFTMVLGLRFTRRPRASIE